MLKSKITVEYERHNCERICQGDILRDFHFTVPEQENKLRDCFLPYCVIVSQDCDLQHSLTAAISADGSIKRNNQYLPTLLILPAFPAAIAKKGEHLKELFGILQEEKDRQRWKVITQNKNERYHFLNSYPEYQVPDLLIDFKTFFGVPMGYVTPIHKGCYLATINELYRESLSQRFSNYLGRIGLPEVQPPVSESATPATLSPQ